MQTSASNRTQLAYKLEGVYPTNFGNAPVGDGTLLNLTGESLAYDLKTEKSKQLRPDRLTQDIVQVGSSAQGGINIEAQYKEYDPLIEAIVQSPFVVYGTLGVSTASTGTLTPTTSTVLTASVAPTGVDAFANLLKGQWFGIVPAVGASETVKKYLKGRVFRVSPDTAPTTTALTLDPATPINTSIITSALAIGWRIASSYAVNGNVMKSFQLEVAHGDIGQFRQYKGMVPSKMDLKLSSVNIVTGSFDFMGQGFDLVQATTMGTPVAAQTFSPANATRGVFDIFENGASISASTFIKSVDFSIDNSLRVQDAVGVFGAAGIASGEMNIMAKLEVYFTNATLYQKTLDGLASSLSLPILDSDGNGYVYFMPRIKYTAVKVNASGRDQDNMISVDAHALPETNTASPWFGKALVVFRIGSPTIPAVDTRMRSASGTATAYLTPATLFASMVAVPGASNGGKSGTVTVASAGATDYGWVAVMDSAAPSGLRFTDNIGDGGWSGAGDPNDNDGASPSVSVSPSSAFPAAVVTYTDGNGTTWRFYRQDYAASGTWSIS